MTASLTFTQVNQPWKQYDKAKRGNLRCNPATRSLQWSWCLRPCQPSCQTLENNFRTHFQSPYVVSHTRRCLDGSTLATLFCLNYFAANLGYKYLFLLHEKQSTLGVWKTAPTSAAWATAFYSTCSHFCNCCTYSHSVCSKMKKKTFPLLHLFNRGLTSTPLWLFFSSSLPLFLLFELASELIMGTWVWSVIDADRGFTDI